MEIIPTLTVVAAALVDRDGRILLQRRSAHREMADLWEFPGGKIESGEQPEAALIRELQEELGIEVTAEDLVPATFASAPLGRRHLLLLLYVCRRWSGDPAPLDSAGLKWVRINEMRELPMPPADVPLVEMLERIL